MQIYCTAMPSFWKKKTEVPTVKHWLTELTETPFRKNQNCSEKQTQGI